MLLKIMLNSILPEFLNVIYFGFSRISINDRLKVDKSFYVNPIGIVLSLIFTLNFSRAQAIYFNAGYYYSLEQSNSFCTCDYEQLFFLPIASVHATMTTDTSYVVEFNNQLLEIDLINGTSSLYFDFDPLNIPDGGIVCVASGIFYMMQQGGSASDELWRLNTNDGTATIVGYTGFSPEGDLTLYNGEIYYYTNQPGNASGIVKVDISNPANSEIIFTIPSNQGVFGLTASPFCNSLLGTHGFYGSNETSLALINLIDGSLTLLCSLPNASGGLTSMLEFAEPADCENTLDLDCNDSSGATGADYNSSAVTCLMRQAPVADEDVRMFYDDWISEMTIRVTGFVPDGLNEIIDIKGSFPGIDVDGQGTDLLILSNAGGARSTDFIDALHLVRYMNTALNPTAGERTIEVQFTTQSGGMSNVAIAYIHVNELPPLDVDLGPDQIICDGSSAFFDAGSFPGGLYQWSSGQMTQTITTIDDGQYIVTISDATHCPGTDTAEVVTIPLISVALTGDVVICDNQSAALTLNTNAPFPITVEIQADPGSPFVFDDVVGNYSFTDLPQQSTTYTITSVTPSMEACITITDVEQTIECSRHI
jgi:hypothetical protein